MSLLSSKDQKYRDLSPPNRLSPAPCEQPYVEQLTHWLNSDEIRLAALQMVAQLNLPQGMVAAGFIRNLVWDKLHQCHYPLNDVDVIYYDASDVSIAAEQAYCAQLHQWQPALPWSVKNQARMHLRNGDEPYQSCVDAMSFWPERETAVAASINNQKIELFTPWGLSSLFQLLLTPNSRRDQRIFQQRLASKNWLQRYPKLQLVTP
ncbi:nucleotidyltransferase family protein [Shewanella sp. Scap07]|nr:nucleotidyltransferase family protein [Shewanella sp. Scap07]